MKTLLLFGAIVLSINAFSQVPNYVPSNGLVAWYPFNGNANDESLNTNDGVVNGATLTTDRFGSLDSAYYFVVNNTIDFGMSNDFAVTTLETKTVSLWFQSTTGQYPFLNKYQNSVASNSNFFIGNDAPAFSMSDGIIVTANGNVGLFHPFQAGNWFHVVVIYSGPTGTVELYINGIQVETTTILVFNSSASTNPLIIQGTKMNTDYEDADGKIDDVGFWNRALTECEIQDLYNSQLNSTVFTATQTGTTLSADQTGATYQWLDCNDNNAIINGETNQSYTPTPITGNYAVEVTLNGCVDTSACLLVDYTGLSDLYAEIISIYPNPTSDVLTITGLNEVNGLKSMEITSTTGKLVMKIEELKEELDVSKLPTGVYFLNIVHEQGIETIRFVKQ